jgi:hypothetical protein
VPGESSYRFCSGVDRLAKRVAARHLQASQVRILVDVPATLAAREKFKAHPEAVIATFDSSLTLYRIFDGEELARILSSGKITGGNYAVKAERAHGASWGEDISAVIRWGNQIRGARLGKKLYLARLDATGFRFFHLDPEIPDIDPNGPSEQPATMNRARINVGLGASIIDVGLDDVDLYTVREDGQISKLTTAEAKAQV